MNEVIKNILTRRTCRMFKEDKIDKSLLEELIKAGAYAPSAMNQQPCHFTVITNKELIDSINLDTKEILRKNPSEYTKRYGSDEKFHVFHNAPAVIVVSHKIGTYNPKVDCAAATENILLAAHSLGIGSCWVGFVNLLFEREEETSEKYKKVLEIPEDYQAIHAIALGYSSFDDVTTLKEKNISVNYID